MTIGFSTKGCLDSENKYDGRGQDWLVQRFGLWRLQRLDAIQAELAFLRLPHLRRQKEALLAGWLKVLAWPVMRVWKGIFGIRDLTKIRCGKMINILTGSGIWLFPGKRDSPKIGYGMRDLCLHVCRECRKPSRPTGSSGQSESTRRALSDVSFQTKHPIECLVNRS